MVKIIGMVIQNDPLPPFNVSCLDSLWLTQEPTLNTWERRSDFETRIWGV